jgi:hypothetical protein
MPLSFQTCLLVTALASRTNAQVFFNLETDGFSWDRQHVDKQADIPNLSTIEEYDEERAPQLDHQHDVEDYHYHEEERLRHAHMQFKEVHHPGEDIHYGSHGDEHDHQWPTSS